MGPSEVVKSTVKDFFEKDGVSYQAPGKRDAVITRNDDGEKIKLQKKYLTITLKEAFFLFKADHPEVRIGFSSFCELRPVQVKLRDETPANVCLCEEHENMRLLINSIPWLPNSTTEFIKDVVCADDKEECMYQKCRKCANCLHFSSLVADQRDSDLEELIYYKQWDKEREIRIQRNSYRDKAQKVVSIIQDKLPSFLRHVFIKRKQGMFFEKVKTGLKHGEVVMQMDFSQNYHHKTQDEIQSAYYSYTSSTLFTCMVYFGENDKICNDSYVIITDFSGYKGSKGHDKYSVSCFTKLAIEEFMKRQDSYQINKLIFFSDGTGQHFKQKYSLCQVVTLNFPDIQEVEWHFFATSHGKGPIDGLGGTIKRRVSEYIMGDRNYNAVTTEDFAKVAQERCPNIIIQFVPHDQVLTFIREKIAEKWTDPKTEKDIVTAATTRSCHVFKKTGEYTMAFGAHSYLPEAKLKHHSFVKTTPDESTTPTTPTTTESEINVHRTIPEIDEASQCSLSPIHSPLMDIEQPDITQYSAGDWIYVSYNAVKILPGLITEVDKEKQEYFVRSMVANGRGSGYYIWPCRCIPPSTSLGSCQVCEDCSWVADKQIIQRLSDPTPDQTKRSKGYKFKDLVM